MRPIAACAMLLVERTRVSQVTPETPGIPRVMVLTASFVLSPVIGLFCHRRRRNCSRQLDASVEASGPHDFSVRKNALSSLAHLASIASRTNVRDDRETPLSVGRDGVSYGVIRFFGKPEYFCERGWTGCLQNDPTGK